MSLNAQFEKKLSWEAFKEEINSLPKPKSETDKILFRGHADSAWKLKTTLERAFGRTSEKKYFSRIRVVRRHLITCLGYNVPTFDYDPKVYDHNQILYIPPGIEFLTFLRHNGFPSPLLDWSLSPYVAAFFAFSDAITDGNDCEKNIAIYTFKEFVDSAHTATDGEPWIIGIGDCIATHKRHFLQQSRYTLCIEKLDGEDENSFGDHEAVCAKSGGRQDVLHKYTIPWNDRKAALRDLDEMNINAYSLFENEEGLMACLFNRNFYFLQ